MPPTQPAEEKKPKKARNEMPAKGPNPAHKLLDAVSAALKAGVPVTEVVLLVDMARQAYGTDQGTSWKMIASSLNERADATTGGTVPGDGNHDGSPAA